MVRSYAKRLFLDDIYYLHEWSHFDTNFLNVLIL